MAFSQEQYPREQFAMKMGIGNCWQHLPLHDEPTLCSVGQVSEELEHIFVLRVSQSVYQTTEEEQGCCRGHS